MLNKWVIWTPIYCATITEFHILFIVVVQSLSHVQHFATPWTAAHQTSLTFTISKSLLKLMSIESVILSNHFILCRPLLLLPSVFPNIRERVGFQKASALAFWAPKPNNFSPGVGGGVLPPPPHHPPTYNMYPCVPVSRLFASGGQSVRWLVILHI